MQIFFLISIHELAHIFAAILLRYPISEIVIYPFGLSMQVEQLEFRHSLDEMMIASAGLVSYLISHPLLALLLKMDLISPVNWQWMNQINQSILLFNSLPIYPLDGGRIVHSLFHLWMPYQKARIAVLCWSLVLLLCTAFYYVKRFDMLAVIYVFLFMQLAAAWKYRKAHARNFYLFRYLHPFFARKKEHRHADLLRNYQNLVKINGKTITEQEWLHHHVLEQQPGTSSKSIFL